MEEEKIIIIFKNHKENAEYDLEIPLNITVNELIIGLNKGFNLNLKVDDISKCYLKTENPIALLKGNKTLKDYGLRNGSVINYTE